MNGHGDGNVPMPMFRRTPNKSMSLFSISKNTFGKPTVSIEIENEIVGWAIVKDGTLEHIGVSLSHRRKGYARNLIVKTIEWMKKTKTRCLRFENFHEDFWHQMKIEMPKNVKKIGHNWFLFC